MLEEMEIDSGTVFTRRKRRKAMLKSTLFDLAASTILANKARFNALAEHAGVNPFLKAPNCVKARLMDKCQFDTSDEQAEEQCSFLRLLLNDEVRNVSFAFLPDTPSAMHSVTDAWFALTQKCPKLQKLACEDFYANKSHRLVVFFGFALHFGNLRHLDMPDLWCDDLRLEMIAKHLTHLRKLRVKLEKGVSARGIGALAPLKQLREFLYKDEMFVSFESRNKSKQHYALCLQLLPQLRVSCASVELQLELDDFNTNFASKAFCTLRDQLPQRLGLRHLALHHAYAMPSDVVLPNLKTLYLFRPQPHFRFGLQLATVTELALHRANKHVVSKILEAIGKHLRKLAVSISDTMLLDNVLEMCPHLRTFFICDFPAHFFGMETPLREGSLDRLREFGFLLEKYDESKHPFKAHHLLSVLRAAPNVRVLRMPGVFFDATAADAQVSEALRMRTVLQKLQHLHFMSEWSLGSVVPEDLFAKYAVLRAALQHCPKLVSVVT